MTKKRSERRAFTLVEMLVVLGIIVIIVVLAVPAFRAMSGGRSVEAASNNLSAILGAARAHAIGQQKTAGVLFILDPATDRVNALLVVDDGPPAIFGAGYTPAPGAAYLDVTDPVQSIMLPAGVGLQVLDDEFQPGPPRLPNDRYIGMNNISYRTAANTVFNGRMSVYTDSPGGGGGQSESSKVAKCAGAILFDSQGRVISRPYRLKLGTGVGMTELHRLLRYYRGTNFAANIPEGKPGGTNGAGSVGSNGLMADPNLEVRSSVGLVLYDQNTFAESPMMAGQPPTLGRLIYTSEDPQLAGTNYGAAEQYEERWLEQDGLSFFINRYNGSLIKAE